MERSQVLDAMSQLKLYGMKAAYDEIITTAVRTTISSEHSVPTPAVSMSITRRPRPR